MDIEVLRAELANDPLGRGYANMSDVEVAQSLNADTRLNRGAVPLWQVKKHAIENGYWLSVKAVASNPSHPAYAAAASAYDYITDMRFENLDMGLPSTQAMIAGLVLGGVITQEQAASLDALANGLQSRAVELGLGIVGDGHVKSVRNL